MGNLIKAGRRITGFAKNGKLIQGLAKFGKIIFSKKQAPSVPDWDPILNSGLNFGQLKNSFPSLQYNSGRVVTLSQFMADNYSGSTFTLNNKYKTSGVFDPNLYVIMINDYSDLVTMSEQCYAYHFSSPFYPSFTSQEAANVFLKANYVLGNNIDATSDPRQIIPIGLRGSSTPSQKFAGTFDGQGFEITGLKLTLTGTFYIEEAVPLPNYGLFANIGSSGTVKNLGIRDTNYTQQDSASTSLKAGGIAGRNEGKIEFCFVVNSTADNTIQLTNSFGEVGGVVHTNAGTISNVYYSGPIVNDMNPSNSSYNPVVFTTETGSSISEAYYNSGSYDSQSTVTAIANVEAKTDAQLITRSGIFAHSNWYTDNYNATNGASGYTAGYPRLQGFSFNSGTINASNPYVISKPADLVFFTNALTENASFGSSVNSHYKIDKCIDMTTVSDKAYKTPGNPMNGTISASTAGTSCSCNGAADHPGTGFQRNSHCIINLRYVDYTSVQIDYVNYLFMGLIYSDIRTGGTLMSDINFVGGSLSFPALNQTLGNTSEICVGTAAAYGTFIRFENIHSSAAVTLLGNGTSSYASKISAGGICGKTNNTSNTTKYYFLNCSNNGKIDGGMHNYISDFNNSSAVGGIVGANAGVADTTSTNTTRGFRSCANFAELKGITYVSVTEIQDGSGDVISGIPLYTAIGGIMGESAYNTNASMMYLKNTGKIISCDPIVKPVTFYYCAGLFGISPMSGHTSVTNDSYLSNSGDIYLYPVVDGGSLVKTSVYGAGISAAGASYSRITARGHNFAYNTGNIIIDKNLLAFSIGGLVSGTSASATSATDVLMPFTAMGVNNGYNQGLFLNSPTGTAADTLIVNPKYDSSIAGISGANPLVYQKSAAMTNCYNYTNLNILLDYTLPAPTTINNFDVAGIAALGSTLDCDNMGAINVRTKNSRFSLNVAGILTSQYSVNSYTYSTSGINHVPVTVSTENHVGATYVAGIVARGDAGGTAARPAENNGAITVFAKNMTGNLAVSGVSCNSINPTAYNAYAVNNAMIKATKTISSATTASLNTITGVKGTSSPSGASYVGFVYDATNNGNIEFDLYFEPGAPAAARNYDHSTYIAGAVAGGADVQRCRNNGNITVAKDNTFYGSNIYVGGVILRALDTATSSIFSDCYNTGAISNNYPLVATGVTSSLLRTVTFNGICVSAGIATSRLVNTGNVTMNIDSSDEKTSYSVNGVGHNVASAGNTTRLLVNFENISNTGTLTFNHTATTLPLRVGVMVSGIFSKLYNSYRLDGQVIETRNLINKGDINVNIKTNGITHTALNAAFEPIPATSGNYLIADSLNVAVGGISAAPAGSINTFMTADKLPLYDSMNLGNINCNFAVGGAADPSLFYSVGGIAGFTASSATNSFISNNKLQLLNCTNGGNINVTASTSPTTNAVNGVGGILGFGYQFTSGTTAADTSSIIAGIYNSVNFGNISGGSVTGGIVGLDGAVISNVINFGTVTTASGGSAGGIIGAVTSAGVSASKTHKNRLTLNLDGIVNYGSVTGGSSAGSIIGKITVDLDSVNGARRFNDIINATNTQFCASSVAQNGAAVSKLYGFTTASEGPFSGNIVLKNGNAPTDPQSIYYNDGTNNFEWRSNEDIETKSNPNAYFAYLLPADSAVHQRTSNYPNGIYAVSTTNRNSGGYYPADFMKISACDPYLNSAGTSVYSAWRTKNLINAHEKCFQKDIYSEANILKLDLIRSGGTQRQFSSFADIDTAVVDVYVIKDGFTPGIYTPYFGDSLLSSLAVFAPNTSFDLTGTYVFDGSVMESYECTVIAQSGYERVWTVNFITVEVTNSIVVSGVYTSKTPGTSLTNATVAAQGNPMLNITPGLGILQPVVGDSHSLILNDPIDASNRMRILVQLQTEGLRFDYDRMTTFTLKTMDGVTIFEGISSGSGTSQYYRIRPAITGPESVNYTVRPRTDPLYTEDEIRYKKYYGEMTVLFEIHDYLPSGQYKMCFTTEYGDYDIVFTKDLSTACSVISSPIFYLKDSTYAYTNATSSIPESPNGFTNTTVIPYGNCPNLQLFNTDMIKGMFYPALSYSARSTATPIELVSFAENADGSKRYLLGFTITAENTDYSKYWVIEIKTLAPIVNPAVMSGYFNGNPYTEDEINDLDKQDEIFHIFHGESANFNVYYNIANGLSSNTVFKINDPTHFDFKFLYNGVEMTAEEYTAYGFTLTMSFINNIYQINVNVGDSIPEGKYEIRAYYKIEDKPYYINPGLRMANSQILSRISWKNIEYGSFIFNKDNNDT